jgi:hypothetical protein
MAEVSEEGLEDRPLSPAGPGGRRRRVVRGRQRSYHLRLSEAEESELVPLAAAMGVSLQRFLVECARAGSYSELVSQRAARSAVFKELLAARRDLRGAVVNLNQLARFANEVGGLPKGWREVIARVEAAQERLGELAPEAVRQAGRVVDAVESLGPRSV